MRTKDGFEEVVLSKPWLDQEPGATVVVDPERAAQMRRDGFAEPELPEVTRPRKRKGKE